jgi:TPR repeat protein
MTFGVSLMPLHLPLTPSGRPLMFLLARVCLCCTLIGASMICSAGVIDSRAAIERSVRYIDQQHYSLARAYLEIPLVDPRITITERSRAYYLRGFSFERQSLYVSAAQDYAKALAFNPSNPATLAALGNLYHLGLGISEDATAAARLLRQAAELGHPPAMTQYGALLLDGAGVNQDLSAARRWLERAAEGGEGAAYIFLAKSHRIGYSDPAAPQQALALYEKALVLNETAALTGIGHMYLAGELGAPDTVQAASYFRRGADRGSANAQASLGYLYLVGEGVAADAKLARTLFEQAAAAGEASAHHNLGYLAETGSSGEGEGEASAQHAASTHYSRAAALNYVPAMLRLSELAQDAGDTATTIRYLNQAVTAGATAASNELAWLLATNSDVELRDGTAALTHALRAVSDSRSSATLDTLAAAYAEATQFDAAIRTQQEALALLLTEATGDTYLDEYNRRLAAYKAQRPWRTP